MTERYTCPECTAPTEMGVRGRRRCPVCGWIGAQ
jgi:DNA-directed RNA polymerase subunit RPC12/RpoP